MSLLPLPLLVVLTRDLMLLARMLMLLDNLSERLLAFIRTPCLYSSQTGRDAIEQGGDSQDERDAMDL